MSNELVIRSAGTLASYAENLDQQLKVCDLWVKSGALPKQYQTAQQVFAVVSMGAEYGFSPMRAIHLFDFIEGRASPRAAALLAKAQQSGGIFKIENQNNEITTVRAIRKTSANAVTFDETESFSMIDAKVAGLSDKPNWKRYPRDMMYWRCVSRLVKRGWADVLGGLDSYEEIHDAQIVPADPVKQAEAIPTANLFRYDLSSMDAATKSNAVTYLCSKGAKKDIENDNIWFSSERLKKLDNFNLQTPKQEVTISEAGSEAPSDETIFEGENI